jgi:hypothetical protein
VITTVIKSGGSSGRAQRDELSAVGCVKQRRDGSCHDAMLTRGNFAEELVLQITNTKAYHKVLGKEILGNFVKIMHLFLIYLKIIKNILECSWIDSIYF